MALKPQSRFHNLLFNSNLLLRLALCFGLLGPVAVLSTGCPSPTTPKVTKRTPPPARRTQPKPPPSPFAKQYKFPAVSILSPSRGPRFAPLQVLELVNPLTPEAQQLHQLRSKLWQKYPGLIRWTVRFSPNLSNDRSYWHTRAMFASNRLGIFWSFLDQWYSKGNAQASLTHQDMLKLAEQCGADPQAYELKLLYEPHKMLLDRDMRWAHRLKLTGKTRLFVNGALLQPPYTEERVLQAMEWAKMRAFTLIRQGVPSRRLYDFWLRAGTAVPRASKYPAAIRPRRYVHVPFQHIEGTPVRGPGDAAISIVEYSDFTCRPCRKAYLSLHQLMKKYPNKIRFYFKTYPIGAHADSYRSAELAAAAQAQKKFWPLYDLLFREQRKLLDGEMLQLAKRVGIDPRWISGELDRKSFLRQVIINKGHGRKMGVRGVPLIVIDGRKVYGARNLKQLVEIAEQELWKAGYPKTP
ncbi:MAG: hypothetical protein EP343_13990 [Deltaproteobacteria bacterium]|nr:MAG: hypothetical protein EP343_13990 [Deltaproteobacteria bacterium]